MSYLKRVERMREAMRLADQRRKRYAKERAAKAEEKDLQPVEPVKSEVSVDPSKKDESEKVQKRRDENAMEKLVKKYGTVMAKEMMEVRKYRRPDKDNVGGPS
jgi:hypothetical protein